MSEHMQIVISEMTPAENWPTGRKPDWYDPDVRLYFGFNIGAAGRKWKEIVVAFDDGCTTAYLTQGGFNLQNRGPAIHMIRGERAQYRKVIREWFLDTYKLEVVFN